MKAKSNQSGQGIMEYVVLTSLIGIFCLVAVKQFGQVLKARVENIKQEIVEHVDLK